MSRTTQFMGLNNRAKSWLNEYCISVNFIEERKRFYDDGSISFCKIEGKELLSGDTEKKVFGMFNEVVYSLKKYELKSGGFVEEYIQAEPWGSGPMIFLALRFDSSKEPIRKSLWTSKERGITSFYNE